MRNLLLISLLLLPASSIFADSPVTALPASFVPDPAAPLLIGAALIAISRVAAKKQKASRN
jgi:hypothetical protein